MFDSMYDKAGHEWQTKAFNCTLEHYKIGDRLPIPPFNCQVEILGGGTITSQDRDSYATIHEGHIKSIDDERDDGLYLLDYHGGWTVEEEA